MYLDKYSVLNHVTGPTTRTTRKCKSLSCVSFRRPHGWKKISNWGFYIG